MRQNLSEQAKRNEYWLRLRRLKREWEMTAIMDCDLDEYVRAVAGIELIYIDGNISSDYRIVDEEQYLMFLLRWS